MTTRGSKHHYIQNCQFCDEPFCQTCSSAEESSKFCSDECEQGDKKATRGCGCGKEITTCELCGDCAKGNDPFYSSKYRGDYAR